MDSGERIDAPEKTAELAVVLENKVAGWLKRPGEIYLGKEGQFFVLRGYPKGKEPIEYDEPLSRFIREDPSKNKSLETYIHGPHIILSFVPEHFRTVRRGLFKREKIRNPDLFEIKVVDPDIENGGNKVRALILLKGRRQIACRFEEITEPCDGCDSPPCQIKHEDWKAKENDLVFYDSLLGNPGITS